MTPEERAEHTEALAKQFLTLIIEDISSNDVHRAICVYKAIMFFVARAIILRSPSPQKQKEGLDMIYEGVTALLPSETKALRNAIATIETGAPLQ